MRWGRYALNLMKNYKDDDIDINIYYELVLSKNFIKDEAILAQIDTFLSQYDDVKLSGLSCWYNINELRSERGRKYLTLSFLCDSYNFNTMSVFLILICVSMITISLVFFLNVWSGILFIPFLIVLWLLGCIIYDAYIPDSRNVHTMENYMKNKLNFKQSLRYATYKSASLSKRIELLTKLELELGINNRGVWDDD